jgi:hypothetical protein
MEIEEDHLRPARPPGANARNVLARYATTSEKRGVLDDRVRRQHKRGTVCEQSPPNPEVNDGVRQADHAEDDRVGGLDEHRRVKRAARVEKRNVGSVVPPVLVSDQ